MLLKTTRELSNSQKNQIFEIWNNVYPKNLTYKSLQDFEEYLSKLKDQNHILVEDENGEVFGWYFDFIRDKERWFTIILDPQLHGQGFGSQILGLAKEANSVLNGWVIDHDKEFKQSGEPYKSPLQFYIKNDFEVLTEIRIETEILSAIKIRWEKE